MSDHTSSKFLEITVISAQDLPPVAKVLRTYAVAWLQSDQKLTTRIDHHGHTNPKWDYKLVFPLDENFSKSDTTTILTIQIYNVVWLRDIPIGTAQVLVSNLLAKKLKNNRPFALRMCRPTGLLQGIVNIGVNLIDYSSGNGDQTAPPSVSEANKQDDQVEKLSVIGSMVDEGNRSEKIKIERSRSERTAKDEDFSVVAAEEGGDRAVLTRSKSGYFKTPAESICSMARPLPSEVVEAFKKGIYSNAGDDFGSSIFDNWTVANPTNKSGRRSPSSMVRKWKQELMNDNVPLIEYLNNDFDTELGSSKDQRRKKKGKRGGGRGGGLLSCFGNVNGIEFSFICGNSEAAKKKKKEILSSNKRKGFK